MKSKIALLLVICLMLLCSGSAFAEPFSAPEWASEGWRWLKSTVKTGTEYIRENFPVWQEAVESSLSEIGADPGVQEAWNTLKDGAEKAGTVSREALDAAYSTVREWMDTNGKDISREVASSINRMAAAAGVDTAKIAEWVRTVEDFLTANKDTVTDSVREAWEVLKAGAGEAGTVTQEKLTEAYHTLDQWLDGIDTEEAQQAGEALDHVVNG